MMSCVLCKVCSVYAHSFKSLYKKLAETQWAYCRKAGRFRNSNCHYTRYRASDTQPHVCRGLSWRMLSCQYLWWTLYGFCLQEEVNAHICDLSSHWYDLLRLPLRGHSPQPMLGWVLNRLIKTMQTPYPMRQSHKTSRFPSCERCVAVVPQLLWDTKTS